MPATPAVCLPASPARRDAPAPASAPPTILVVEDDDCVAGLFQLLLAPVGLRVLRAREGAEGLRLFQQHRAGIALVVMDCGLPDTHGGSLCLRLRHAAPSLPLMLTSGRGRPASFALLAAEGPTAFLAKPFRPGELGACVRGLLGPRRPA